VNGAASPDIHGVEGTCDTNTRPGSRNAAPDIPQGSQSVVSAVAARRTAAAGAAAWTACTVRASVAGRTAIAMRAWAAIAEVTAPARPAAWNMHRSRRFRKRWHARGIDDDSPLRTRAETFAADVILVAQRNVDDAALAAVHGIEAERRSGSLDLVGRGEGAHPQFLDAQSPVVICVEGDSRMLVGMHSQHFLRHQFEAQKQLGLVGEKQFDIAALEFDGEVGALEIWVGIAAGFDEEVELKTGVVYGPAKKFFNSWTCFVQGKSAAHAVFRPFGVGLLAGTVAGKGGAVLLKNHCCAMLTRLLVR
jgi:hypothetical protein